MDKTILSQEITNNWLSIVRLHGFEDVGNYRLLKDPIFIGFVIQVQISIGCIYHKSFNNLRENIEFQHHEVLYLTNLRSVKAILLLWC